MNMPRNILSLPAASAPLSRKLRVCVYARVSTENEEQKSSYEAQLQHFRDLIRTHPQYEAAGLYADYGLSGTCAEKRPAFMPMIRDCEAGKIDLIHTKSLSRFARNTLQCLSFVRHLNSLGVHIIFENNHIDTRETFSELLLTVLSALAQEESRSISENTAWGIRKRFENGMDRWCHLYGYAKTDQETYQIVPQQALVVRKIFSLYELGASLRAVCRYLQSHQIPSPTGGARWSHSVVYHMLCNEKNMGDILLQKYYTENHLTHKICRNNQCMLPAYYIENHHPPIVSRRQFERVQLMLTRAKSG